MKHISVKDKHDFHEDGQFWKAKTAEERVAAVEFLRKQYYIIKGCKKLPRLRRVLKVVERTGRKG